jgi:hypothetical protein
MPVVNRFAVIVLISCTLCCKNSKQKEIVHSDQQAVPVKVKPVKNFKEVPSHITRYLDSLSGTRFLIANPGEQWSAGCVRINGLPNRQLIWATIDDNSFTMKYQSGGFVSSYHLMKVELKNGQVQNLYLDSISNPTTIY